MKTRKTKKPCEYHYWNYVHCIYSGKRGGTVIRRYCDCGISQVGEVSRWRPEHENEFDENAKVAGK